MYDNFINLFCKQKSVNFWLVHVALLQSFFLMEWKSWNDFPLRNFQEIYWTNINLNNLSFNN